MRVAALPGASLFLGWFCGLVVTRAALARAHAFWMAALPLSTARRRRAVLFASGAAAGAQVGMIATASGLACTVLAQPHPWVWGGLLAGLFAGGYAAGAACALGGKAGPPAMAVTERRFTTAVPVLHVLDRGRPRWLGTWAWNLPAGRLLPSLRLAAIGATLLIATALGAAIGLARHAAGPVALAGLAGGLSVFMLTLRMRPLGSPVLRAAPVSFTRVWLRLARLPLVLSAAFFMLPAGAALAAEPAAWPLPVASGLWLMVLNAIYMAFAAYFMTAPLVAATAFVAAVAYTGYESLEYGRTVVLGLAGLVAWLWYQARLRYYHG